MSQYLSVDRAFERAIHRGFGHVRSGELDEVVTAISRFIRHPGADTITRVRNALGHWRHHHPKEYLDRGAPIEDDLRRELHALLDRYKVPKAPPGAPVALAAAPVRDWTPQEVQAWFDRLKPRVLKFQHFAVGDLLHGQPKVDAQRRPLRYDPQVGPNWNAGFARLVPQQARATVLANYNDPRKRGSTAGMQTLMLTGRDWKGTMFANVHNAVCLGQRGVCTTFGLAVAHVLTHGLEHGPRVEVVSWGNRSVGHVYVIVNRQGGYGPGDLLPDDWIQQGRAVVVDAWYGALGRGTVFFGAPRYGQASSMVRGLVCTGEKPAW